MPDRAASLTSRAQGDRRFGRSWSYLDLSRPVLIAVTALLAVMIVLPMGWLMVYSLSDKQGAATLGNFVTLFTDPSFVDPLITTLIIAVSVSTICCIVAAPLGWLVARTDMPIRRTVRTLVMATPGHAALRRRHRLGDAGRAQFGPAEPAVARPHRHAVRRGASRHLQPHRPDLRHRLLHLSLCLHPGGQRARPHARRARGRLIDAGRQDLADGAAHHRAARAADPAGRRPGRLPAGAEPVRLARHPRDPGGLPHAHHHASGACSSSRPSPSSPPPPRCRCCC